MKDCNDCRYWKENNCRMFDIFVMKDFGCKAWSKRTRKDLVWTFDDYTLTEDQVKIAKSLGLSWELVYMRIKRGWKIEDCYTKPKK